MSIVLRSTTALTAPNHAPVVPLGGFGADVLAWWSAESVQTPTGGDLLNVPNSIDATNPLVPAGGVPRIGDTSGRRWLDLAPAANNILDATATVTTPAAVTMVMIARWAAAPASLQQFFATNVSAGALSLDTAGKIIMYGSDGPYPTTPTAPSLNTWHRIIAVINGASSSITVDGVTVVTGSTTNLVGSGKPRLKGFNGVGMKIAAAGIIGHAATAAEIAQYNAAMTVLTPA